ncbi:UPF0262 family protein [Mesorhizobium sp. L2C066B000]|uniref:UPF0262 family protein n=1 Tax=Mesorhizobium sp. L2C066B000 TaxID=1287105 RepID=UPI0003CFB18E|nr:UPF0262 family protein [Mesorhizobium sp. L2C066B000]ESZ25768.1 hypothetical protein X732_33025 [Mesorhizobium sp. L2C066B000]
MTGAEFRLCDVALDCSFKTRDARVEREQAIIDLLEANTFAPIGHDGAPIVLISRRPTDGWHCTLPKTVGCMSSGLSCRSPFPATVKDYTRICESYYDAIRHPGPERLEAIDMGRRGVHNEAAELLRARLSTKVNIDNAARRLFTLIYALCVRNADQRILLS